MPNASISHQPTSSALPTTFIAECRDHAYCTFRVTGRSEYCIHWSGLDHEYATGHLITFSFVPDLERQEAR